MQGLHPLRLLFRSNVCNYALDTHLAGNGLSRLLIVARQHHERKTRTLQLLNRFL